MTLIGTGVCIIVIALFAFIIGALYQLFFDLFKRKEEEEVVTFHPGTSDPQFDELAQLTHDILDKSKSTVRTLGKGYKELQEKDKEIMGLSLDLQRLTLRKELLEEITLDNLVEKWGHLGLGWTTARLVIDYAQLKILELTSD